jgi:D-lyxose ketol-isomerase
MKSKLLITVMTAVMTISACSQGDKRQAATEHPQQQNACYETELPVFDNADFYTGERFNEEAAKDAIIRLMKYYHYPVTEKTRQQLWVSDYGTGRFTELGLAAIMYVNDTQDHYMLQDLFLLPHQMLPEHWHEKPDNANLPAKMEGWLVRNGISYITGEGQDNLASYPEIKIPACHDGAVTVAHTIKALPGDFVPLTKTLSHHWQFAGHKGAIITEVANVHDNASVRHQVKAINDHFLGK